MSINVDRIELENNESWWNPSIDRGCQYLAAEAVSNARDLFRKYKIKCEAMCP